MGMYPRKGAIAWERPDIAVLDPTIKKTVKLEDLHGRTIALGKAMK